MLQLIASIVLMYAVVYAAGVWGTRKWAALKEAEEALESATERTEN